MPISQKHGTILYYVRVFGRYKIGVTSRTIAERFTAKENADMAIIQTWDFDNEDDARAMEKAVLKTFGYGTRPEPDAEPILRSGNSELFTYDVLALDYTPMERLVAACDDYSVPPKFRLPKDPDYEYDVSDSGDFEPDEDGDVDCWTCETLPEAIAHLREFMRSDGTVAIRKRKRED